MCSKESESPVGRVPSDGATRWPPNSGRVTKLSAFRVPTLSANGLTWMISPRACEAGTSIPV